MWHLASCRDDMDWDGFTLWLEADPRHRAHYDEITLTDAALEVRREALRTALEDALPEYASPQGAAPAARPACPRPSGPL